MNINMSSPWNYKVVSGTCNLFRFLHILTLLQTLYKMVHWVPVISLWKWLNFKNVFIYYFSKVELKGRICMKKSSTFDIVRSYMAVTTKRFFSQYPNIKKWQ